MQEDQTSGSAVSAEKDAQSGAGTPATVGQRIRKRRSAKRMTLKQLSEQTGLAEGFLSQLERGLYSGSVATLQKVSAVLGLTVGDLFEESWTSTPFVSIDTTPGTSFGVDARKVRLTPKAFDHFEAFVGIFDAHGSTGTEAYQHGDSEEILVVLEGTVVLTLDDVEHRLEKHESMSYSSELSHRVQEADGATAKVLWVISPPSY